MQLPTLFTKFDKLQQKHGDKSLAPIYGAGEINSPDICLIFMNPTGRNVGSVPEWEGLRAPWLGTRNVWRLLHKLGLFRNEKLIDEINRMKPDEWSKDFCIQVYEEVRKGSLYITNIAKCTTIGAIPLSNAIYREYLPLMLEEISMIKPKLILALGNQVNSVLLQKPISVSNYTQYEYEILEVNENESYKVFPSYYPVGQGTRNINKAIARIEKVLEINGIA